MSPEHNSEEARLRRELAESRAELERLTRRLDEEVGTLNHLVHISTQLNATLNLPELLQLIMNSAKELFRAEACSVLLVDEDTDELIIEVSVGEKSQDVAKQRIPPGQGIAGKVAQTGDPLIVNAVKDSPFFYKCIDQAIGFETRNILAVPLKSRDQVIGVMEVLNTQGREAFEERDQTLALALAGPAAVAVDNARLYQKLSDALIVSRMSYRL